MCCGCGCGERPHGGDHGSHGFPLISIEEEVETLEKMRGTLEENLANVNKRLEVLKR